MRHGKLIWLALILAGAATGRAQQYELGLVGGYGLQRGLTAQTAGGDSAVTGVKDNAVVGFFIGDNLFGRVSGEFRYLYRFGDLRVESAGSETGFGGRSHLFHYDLLFHASPVESSVRPFVATGVGARLYQGTGLERAFQPLSQFVLLSKTSDAKVLVSLGGGVKWAFGRRLLLRLEVRDYLTPAPRKVLTPAPGASVDGWVNDVVPQVGLAFAF